MNNQKTNKNAFDNSEKEAIRIYLEYSNLRELHFTIDNERVICPSCGANGAASFSALHPYFDEIFFKGTICYVCNKTVILDINGQTISEQKNNSKSEQKNNSEKEVFEVPTEKEVLKTYYKWCKTNNYVPQQGHVEISRVPYKTNEWHVVIYNSYGEIFNGIMEYKTKLKIVEVDNGNC